MYCSVKFLSPRVTDGLPLPGWPDGSEDELEELDEELESDDDPQAASASTPTMRIRRDRRGRRTGVLPFPRGLRGARGRSERRRRPSLSGPEPARCEEILHDAEDELGEQGERRHPDGGGEHAGEAVRGLVGDDVAGSGAAEETAKGSGGDD